MTANQIQQLQNAENARLAFLTLSKSLVPVPLAQVLAAQQLIRQTQDDVRAAFRTS